MTKMRFSFDIDASVVFPELSDEEAIAAVERSLLGSARVAHTRLLNGIAEAASLSDADRLEAGRPHVQAIMLTVMAHANWSVTDLSENTPIAFEMSFDR